MTPAAVRFVSGRGTVPDLTNHVQLIPANRNVSLRLRFFPPHSKRKIIMKLTSIGLAAVLALSGSVAFAQTGAGSAGGSAASGTTTGSSMNGTTMGTSPGTTTGGGLNNGMTTGAGSATGGARSNLNPSGNSLINPSPSGSTLTPPPGGR
jgi:hypothetical protein